jgi:hypothetical protein
LTQDEQLFGVDDDDNDDDDPSILSIVVSWKIRPKPGLGIPGFYRDGTYPVKHESNGCYVACFASYSSRK